MRNEERWVDAKTCCLADIVLPFLIESQVPPGHLSPVTSVSIGMNYCSSRTAPGSGGLAKQPLQADGMPWALPWPICRPRGCAPFSPRIRCYLFHSTREAVSEVGPGEEARREAEVVCPRHRIYYLNLTLLLGYFGSHSFSLCSSWVSATWDETVCTPS